MFNNLRSKLWQHKGKFAGTIVAGFAIGPDSEKPGPIKQFFTNRMNEIKSFLSMDRFKTNSQLEEEFVNEDGTLIKNPNIWLSPHYINLYKNGGGYNYMISRDTPTFTYSTSV